jgi:Lysine methyltransferase
LASLTDVAEIFLLFAQDIPSQNLGFLDPKATSLDVDVGRRTYVVSQSPGLLHSNRGGGTTGAVLWKITPLVAAWLSSGDNFLRKLGYLRPDSAIVELGCGISGLIALSLAPSIPSGSYVLTDQSYVMKILRANISTNKSSQPKAKRSHSQAQIHTLVLDWEEDAASNVAETLGAEKEIDLVVACDCIYNDHLIEPFVDACAAICRLRNKGSRKTGLMVAQQLRSEEVLERWLTETQKFFIIFRIPEHLLPEDLRRGYVIHFAVLR